MGRLNEQLCPDHYELYISSSSSSSLTTYNFCFMFWFYNKYLLKSNLLSQKWVIAFRFRFHISLLSFYAYIFVYILYIVCFLNTRIHCNYRSKNWSTEGTKIDLLLSENKTYRRHSKYKNGIEYIKYRKYAQSILRMEWI